MNIADYLIKKLEELGINDFFGLPGDYNFELLYAIENNSNTKWIGCTNELNAGYAADGYARQKGYGAVVTTYGVGELSAINAIAGSFAENVPVISIVGVPSTKYIENNTLLHHNLNPANYKAYENAYKTVTATTAFLNRDNAKLEIDRILKVFVKERKPVYIAIPTDIALQEATEIEMDYNWYSDIEQLEVVVNKIADKIKSSQRPVILGDVLVKRYDAKIEFKEFVEKTGIPTTTFIMGSNLLNYDIKNYLGPYLANYRNQTAKKALDTTDCLIAVGAVYSDLNSFGFHLPYSIDSQIAIYGTYTIIENERYDNVKMADVLEKLTKVLDSYDLDIEREEIGYSALQNEQGKLTSDYIYPRIQEFLKENDILLADTGIIPHGIYEMKMPNNVEVHTQTLWGSIGWATPATLGACIACPNSRTILFTGEGAHQLTAMELGTILRNGLKPTIIVLNNKGYAIERLLSDDPDDSFNNVMQMNYSKFARVFEGDIWSTRVETAEDFDKALKVTQIMNKLCYIEVITEKLDIPKLTEEVISNYKKTFNNTEKKQKNIKEKNFILNKIENMNFGTTVHESLKYEVEADE